MYEYAAHEMLYLLIRRTRRMCLREREGPVAVAVIGIARPAGRLGRQPAAAVLRIFGPGCAFGDQGQPLFQNPALCDRPVTPHIPPVSTVQSLSLNPL